MKLKNSTGGIRQSVLNLFESLNFSLNIHPSSIFDRDPPTPRHSSI